jgi:hypothetical protein
LRDKQALEHDSAAGEVVYGHGHCTRSAYGCVGQDKHVYGVHLLRNSSMALMALMLWLDW